MIQKTRRKKMNKEEIEKIIKEYLKENLRIEPKVSMLMSIAHPRTIWMFTLVKRRFKKFY